MSFAIPILKKYHSHVMGKRGKHLKEIRKNTGAHIQMSSNQDTTDIINITGSRDSVEKAVYEINLIFNKIVSFISLYN